jgi:hypothetical protein
MPEKNSPADETDAAATGPDRERREALIKIGKYAAYTAPAMMVTVGTARAGSEVPTSPPPTAPP